MKKNTKIILLGLVTLGAGYLVYRWYVSRRAASAVGYPGYSAYSPARPLEIYITLKASAGVTPATFAREYGATLVSSWDTHGDNGWQKDLVMSVPSANFMAANRAVALDARVEAISLPDATQAYLRIK